MNLTEQTAIDAVPFAIFDKYAQLRTDFTDEEIAKLPAPKKKIFFALIKAWTAETDAASAHKASKEKLYATVREKDAMAVKLGEARQISRIEALRDNIRARDEARGLKVTPKTVDPAKQAKIQQLADQLQELELAMYEQQLDVDQIARDWKQAREVKAAAMKTWVAAYPQKTPRQAFEEHLARHREHAKSGANVVAKVTHGPASHLDAVLSSGNRGSNVNFGYGRPHAKIFRIRRGSQQ
jgi:hypothetical protein